MKQEHVTGNGEVFCGSNKYHFGCSSRFSCFLILTSQTARVFWDKLVEDFECQSEDIWHRRERLLIGAEAVLWCEIEQEIFKQRSLLIVLLDPVHYVICTAVHTVHIEPMVGKAWARGWKKTPGLIGTVDKFIISLADAATIGVEIPYYFLSWLIQWIQPWCGSKCPWFLGSTPAIPTARSSSWPSKYLVRACTVL